MVHKHEETRIGKKANNSQDEVRRNKVRSKKKHLESRRDKTKQEEDRRVKKKPEEARRDQKSR